VNLAGNLLADEVELRATNLRATSDLDLVDNWAVERENLLNTNTGHGSADREGRAGLSTVLHREDEALEYLETGLTLLDHLLVDTDGVARTDTDPGAQTNSAKPSSIKPGGR